LVEFEQLLDDRQQWLGRDHPDTLNSLQNLAANYRLMGRLAEAEQKFREAYRLRQQVLGSHHPNTINSLNSLATTISAQARYAEANELFEKVLPARVERLGYEHPFTIATMLDLAEGYFRVQRFAEARPLVEQALSFALANLGEKHEMTLRAKASLGALDLQTQEYEKAIALLEDSLELYHRNPSYRWIQDQLLQAYIGDNRVESARKMLADHLTAARLHLSEIPADTLRLAEVLVQLSDAYRALHLWVDAEELLREAVGIRQQALPGSVELSHAQASLGSLVLQRALEVPSPEQNNRPLQEAEALLVSAYEIMEKQQPKTSEDLDKRDAVLADLIRLYEKSNRADEANRYREQTTKPLSASVGSESRNSTGN
jgi:tetratricopeptide (TPR) repeat protein